jgi:YqaJ-like recombinase protein
MATNSSELEQGTQAWKDARLGFVTASRIDDVMSKPPKKGGKETSGRRNYKAQLALEIFSGKSSKEDEFENWWMKRGRELEPDARSEYEMRNGVMVQACGFIAHPSIPRYGCSPDGLIGDDGMVQIKCLTRANHMDCLTSGIPSERLKQMICELSVTGREWNDFGSYHPEYPGNTKMLVKRLWRKDVLDKIEEMEREVVIFNQEVDVLVNALRTNDDINAQLEKSLP